MPQKKLGAIEYATSTIIGAIRLLHQHELVQSKLPFGLTGRAVVNGFPAARASFDIELI